MKKKRTAQSGFSNTSASILCVLLFAISISAYANTITVTNTNDGGPGSLRQALAIANDGDTINFAVTGTIGLISGGLLIAKNVTISGPGSNQLSVDGNQAVLVFGIFPDKTVTISGLSITNGQLGIWNEQGMLRANNCVITANSSGGLYNHGTSTVSNCVVTGNSYGLYNHAVYNYGGATMTIANSVVSDSSGVGIGNGYEHPPEKIASERHIDNSIDQWSGGGGCAACMTITDSTISNNSESGIYNRAARVTILNSTISDNSTGQLGEGGGISTGDFKIPPFTSITNSTISGNSASDSGGGIANDYGLLTIINSTVSGNSAVNDGGGIVNYSGGVQIANSTLSGNSAGSGGGIYNSAGQFGGLLEIGDTILNAGASGENILSNGGTVMSHGYNVCSDNGGGLLNGPGDQINTNPLLGPLQNNGGRTLTHAPLPGSPAIDTGDPNFTPPPYYDQRGRCYRRVFGRRIDVGSVEIQPGPRCPTPAPRP